MKRNMLLANYCKESGFPVRQMYRLVHSCLGEEFSYRTGSGRTSPFWIIVPIFEKMQERGDFKEILEGWKEGKQ